jgi:hypothetical protein
MTLWAFVDGEKHRGVTQKMAGLYDASFSTFKNINSSVSWTERATLVRAFFRRGRRHRICDCVVVPAAAVVILSKESLG